MFSKEFGRQAKIDNAAIKIHVEIDSKIHLHGIRRQADAAMCRMSESKKLHDNNHAVQGETNEREGHP